jgi:hypothetical protein
VLVEPCLESVDRSGGAHGPRIDPLGPTSLKPAHLAVFEDRVVRLPVLDKIQPR